SVPWSATSLKVKVQSGANTTIDIAAVHIMSEEGDSVFQTDFPGSGSSGWSFEGASFGTVGSDHLPAIHLASNNTLLASAETLSYEGLQYTTNHVVVNALVQFEGNSGPFMIGTEWYNSGRSLIATTTGFEAWASYIDIPAALVLRVWYPAIQNDIRLRFKVTSETQGAVFFEIINGGILVQNETIVPYYVGERFHTEMSWVKPSQITLSLKNETTALFSWSSLDAPNDEHLGDLANQSQMDLSVSAETYASKATLQNPVYVFPGTGRFVSFAQSSWPLACGIALLGALVVLWVPEEKKIAKEFRAAFGRRYCFKRLRVFRNHPVPLISLILGGLLYAYLATTYGGHPFDSIVFKTWAYAGQVGGLRGIWGRTTSVTDSFVREGDFPWDSLGFAYLPLGSYLILALSSFVPSFSSFRSQEAIFNSNVLQAEIKWGLGFFTLITSAIIYVIVLRGTGSRRWAIFALALIMLNPAVIFDSAIWGETDSVLYLIFTLFAWLAWRRPGLSLTLVFLGMDFKQTGIILLLPVALMFLMPRRRFGTWLVALSKGTSVFFASLFPLLAVGILPSTLYKTFFTKLADIGTPLGNQIPVVSADTYNAWTIFTGPFGAIHYPANISLFGFLSFFSLGIVSFSALSIFLLARLRKVSRPEPAFWFAFVATVSLAFNVLITGGASRYYTLAIPSLVGMTALGWGRFSKREKAMAMASLSSITTVAFWTMTGLFASIMSFEFPNIHGMELSQNPLMVFIGTFYLNNFVITVGSIVTVVMLWFSVKLALYLASDVHG
ncbi:hypothetical protein J2P12_05380, partial [Candidatus Bathyarchaeota archaeon]|nr:hypothetical protein [Candidatus Bathyarchaeota archaeon]